MIKLIKALFKPCKSPLQRGRKWAIENDLLDEWIEGGNAVMTKEENPYPENSFQSQAWKRGYQDISDMLEILSA